jgi:hypothetical protein
MSVPVPDLPAGNPVYFKAVASNGGGLTWEATGDTGTAVSDTGKGDNNFTLTVTPPPPNATPTAGIDYRSETLLFLEQGTYLLNGNEIEVTSADCILGEADDPYLESVPGAYSIKSLIPAYGEAAVPLTIVKKGNGTTTTNSLEQTNLVLPPRRPEPDNVSSPSVGFIAFTGSDAGLEFCGAKDVSDPGQWHDLDSQVDDWGDANDDYKNLGSLGQNEGNYVVRLKAVPEDEEFAGESKAVHVDKIF